MILPEILDQIIYFSSNPIVDLCLISKYFNDKTKKIRITSNEKIYKITDEYLERLPNLTKLDLHKHNAVTNEGIRKMTKLTKLDLTWNKQITDYGIDQLVNLTWL